VKEIRCPKHLQTNLALRKIPGELATDIYRDAHERVDDRQTGYMVVAKQLDIYGHQRGVVYEEDDETAVITTVHPLKKGQKENRTAAGRRVKL
jgi:RNA binding exosome subunit